MSWQVQRPRSGAMNNVCNKERGAVSEGEVEGNQVREMAGIDCVGLL